VADVELPPPTELLTVEAEEALDSEAEEVAEEEPERLDVVRVAADWEEALLLHA